MSLPYRAGVVALIGAFLLIVSRLPIVTGSKDNLGSLLLSVVLFIVLAVFIYRR